MLDPQQPQESLIAVAYRVKSIESDFAQFKLQLQVYETTRENDLKFRENEVKMQRINDTAIRISEEVRQVKLDLQEVNTRILLKEVESIKRDTDTSSSQDRLQIKVLGSILGTIVLVVTSLFIFYVTHR